MLSQLSIGTELEIINEIYDNHAFVKLLCKYCDHFHYRSTLVRYGNGRISQLIYDRTGFYSDLGMEPYINGLWNNVNWVRLVRAESIIRWQEAGF